MRYAVQIATQTEKTTYYPEEIDKDERKKTTRRRKIEIKLKIITNHKEKRERKTKQFRLESKRASKKRNARENAQIFADCRLARFARGV